MTQSGSFKTHCMLMILACMLFLVSQQGARAQDATPEAGGGTENKPTAVIDLFAESSEDMLGNPETVREMVDLLMSTAAAELETSGFRVRPLETTAGYHAAARSYLLKITLLDYARSGPQRVLFARYELTGNGQTLLKEKKKLATIGGSSKLVRVLGRQVARAVMDRLLEETGKGHGQDSPAN